MAPIHHHFELLGWPETTVIIRIWMLTAGCTAVGLGLFYREFLQSGRTRVSGPDRLGERRLLFHGIGVTNAAAARAAAAHERTVVLSDDGAPDRGQDLARELGVDLHCGAR